MQGLVNNSGGCLAQLSVGYMRYKEDLFWWICVVWWKRLSGRVPYCSSICSSDFSFEIYFTIRRRASGARVELWKWPIHNMKCPNGHAGSETLEVC